MCVCSPGDDVLTAYTSPLLVDLLDAAIRQVNVLLRDHVSAPASSSSFLPTVWSLSSVCAAGGAS